MYKNKKGPFKDQTYFSKSFLYCLRLSFYPAYMCIASLLLLNQEYMEFELLVSKLLNTKT